MKGKFLKIKNKTPDSDKTIHIVSRSVVAMVWKLEGWAGENFQGNETILCDT